MTRALSSKPKSKLPKEVAALARSKKAEATTNDDGSVTLRRTTAKTSKELTTRQGKLRESSLEFNKATHTARGDGESQFVAKTDMLGRESTLARTHFTNNAGVDTETTKGTDAFGVESEAKTVSKTVEKGGTFESSVRFTRKDSLGNAHRASDMTKVTQQGPSTVTTNEKKSKGSKLETRSNTTFENGKFSVTSGGDWFKETRVNKSTLKETDYDATGVLEKTDPVTEWVGKVFKGLGLEQQWKSELDASLMKERLLVSGEHGSVSTRVGVSGGQEASIDSEGIRGSFNRTAVAGVYAQSQGSVDGRFGTASYDARAKVEAVASIDANGKIDANGLDATLNARIGVSVEAEITGRAQTKSVQIGGVDVNAAVEGHAKASAEAVAEATGTVTVTRHPPTAIIRGEAGASAVAKIEGDITASAGPFSIHASAYASAGAEARASGMIGFEDGKLKIGGSLGAALGVGAGADVALEIDVAMIGEMAKDVVDLNHDGKLGVEDAMVAVEKTAKWVGKLFGFGSDPKPGKPPHSIPGADGITTKRNEPEPWTRGDGDAAQEALLAIGALREPEIPGPDATPQQLAQYEKDTKRYDRMMELMSAIIRKRDELQMSIIRKM